MINKRTINSLDFMVTKILSSVALGSLTMFVCPMPALADCAVSMTEVTDKAVAVKGKVVDSKGEGMPGVYVIIKGTGTGTTTDDKGLFSIQASEGQTLEFSFLGYSSRSMNVTSNFMNVVMREDNKTLGEIVVTTQKKSQSSVEVPIAVSALSGASLDKLNLTQFDEVADFIPGVQIQMQSPNNPGYVIRGVTSDDGASYSQPRVSVFQDGVSISRSRASAVDLFDVERVEVVKGPQGTLFGRGAEIGGIHVIRNKPTNKLSGELSIGYGSYNQRQAQGFINTPIIKNKLQNRFAFSYEGRDGFIKNEAGGRLNGKSTIALRNSTRLWTNENTKFDLVLDYQYDDYPGTSFKSNKSEYGNPDPNKTANLEEGNGLYIKRHVGGATFLADHTFSDEWKMLSTTGFRAFSSDEKFDADGTYLPLLACQEKAKGTQFSQEFRFNYDNKSWFSGFVGTSYFFEHSSQEVNVNTNLQMLYPVYIQSNIKSTFSSMIPQIVSAFPEASQSMIQASLEQLLDGLFTEVPSIDSDGNPAKTTTTPDIYNTLKYALSQIGMDLDTVLGSMGEQGQTILATIKGLSNQSLSESYSENGTNYATNQAVEIFADGTFKLAKGLSLTAGIRGTYENQKSEYSSTTVPGIFGAILYTPTTNGAKVSASKDYFSAVGRVALNYMYRHNNFYVSASRGRRPGVIYFNNSPEDLSQLKPETINSYEAGVKGVLMLGRFSYDICAYYYDWNHFQTSRFDQQQSKYVADDAGKAHSFGVELGLSYSPVRFVNIFGNYSYIDGKFNDKDENGVEQEYAGNRFRLTPKHSFSIGVDVTIPTSDKAYVYIRPTYSYKSKVYFEDSNEEELTQDGYGLANFTAGYHFQPKNVYYEISAFGKNIFDTKYIIDAGNTGRQIGYPTFVGGTRSVIGLMFKVGF